jgi:hypothetical protein
MKSEIIAFALGAWWGCFAERSNFLCSNSGLMGAPSNPSLCIIHIAATLPKPNDDSAKNFLRE